MNSREALLVDPGTPTGLQRMAEGRWVHLRQRLLRHARLAVSEPALAEDLVQDSLIAMLERPEAHRGDASQLTWATAILKHKIADWYRSPQRRRMVEAAPDDDGEAGQTDDTLYDAHGIYIEPVPAWQQPEGQEARRQVMSILEQCLRKLPAQTGRVFMMREWLGFETAEICERLGLTPDNCRMILHRARTGLRLCMTHHGHTSRSVA